MDKKAKVLAVLGLGGVAAYFLLKDKSHSIAVPASGAAGPLNLTREPSTKYATPPSTRPSPVKTMVGTTAQGVAIGASFGPVGAVIGGAVGAMGGAILSIFGGSDVPLEPVSKILITQFPYAYADQGNIPPGNGVGADSSKAIYALDRYGYLWPIGRPLNECGWLDREVIAVDWKVFTMMPKGNSAICHPEEIDRMPRPMSADLLRGAFGNDIRFYIGSERNVHGPWESSANVAPFPGTPAQWSAIVGDYKPPTVTTSGDWA